MMHTIIIVALMTVMWNPPTAPTYVPKSQRKTSCKHWVHFKGLVGKLMTGGLHKLEDLVTQLSTKEYRS